MFILSQINPTAIGVIRNLQEAGLPYRVLQAGLSDFLADLCREPLKKALFIVPTSDADILAIHCHFDALTAKGYAGLPDRKSLLIALDKYLQYSLLVSHSITTPFTVLVDGKNIEKIQFSGSRILKPCFSGDWKTQASMEILGDQKAIIVTNPQELKFWQQKTAPVSSSSLILQEIIQQKDDENYSFCGYADSKGRIIWSFMTQKIIQYPAGFGTALMCRTLKNPDVDALGRQVVLNLGIEGIFEIEMIRSLENNQLYVIEINLRHWSQHRLSVKMGVNLTLLDFYHRRGDQEGIRKLLCHSRFSRALWIDDTGYVIHCLKNTFHPQRCRISEFFRKKIEFSTFSFKEPSVFVNAVLAKLR